VLRGAKLMQDILDLGPITPDRSETRLRVRLTHVAIPISPLMAGPPGDGAGRDRMPGQARP
jgi:hypothetical protein